MKYLSKVDLSIIEELMTKHNSNIRFDNYGLDEVCPKNEFECYKIKLERNDMERIYLVANFSDITNRTCLLKDVNREIAMNQEKEKRGERIKSLMEGGGNFARGVDLLKDKGFDLIAVAKDLEMGPVLIVDGSHRAIAHFLVNKDISGIPVYLGVHKNIGNFGFYKQLPKVQ